MNSKDLRDENDNNVNDLLEEAVKNGVIPVSIVPLITHYPDYFKENQEINAICNALDPEFALVFRRITVSLLNTLPQTADSDGLKTYEEWLGIITDPYKPLEQRRAEVLAKLNETLPYTEIRLQRMLAAIAGWDHFIYKRKGAYVSVELDDKSLDKFEAVFDMLDRVLPMNLHYDTILDHVHEEDRLLFGIATVQTEIIRTPIDYSLETAPVYLPMGTIVTEIIKTKE